MGRRPRVTIARPAGDGAGAARGPTEGHIPDRRLTKRRSLRLPCCVECAFPLRCRPGGVGHNPPASLRGTMENGPTGQTCSSNPPPGCGGGCAGDPQASAGGPGTSRKGAVWAEGLAESAPRARPGHHQAASCGLRRRRKLSITSLAPRPPRPLSCELRAMGVDTGFPALSAPLVRGPLSRASRPSAPLSGAYMIKTLIEAGFRWPYEVNTG